MRLFAQFLGEGKLFSLATADSRIFSKRRSMPEENSNNPMSGSGTSPVDPVKTETERTEKISEQPEPVLVGAEKLEPAAQGVITGESLETESKPELKTKKILRMAALMIAGLLILTGGIVTGAWMQKRNSGSIANSNDGAISGLPTGDESFDLTTDVLLEQTENKENSSDKNDNIITMTQLIDGGGGGKLVNSIALMPKEDKLTLELLRLNNQQQNSCFSPLSVRYALEMLRTGADGDTKAQLDAVLGDYEATRYDNIADRLSVANSLWIQDDYAGEIKSSYTDTLADKFNAEVKQDSFQTAANMNSWIEKNSFGMLKNVLKDSDILGMQASLINVLAIDMNWENEFLKISTKGAYFGNSDYDPEFNKVNKEYTTMSGGGGEDVYYNLAADATVLAKDLKEYNGTRLQFVAILPKNDLSEFIQNVSNEQINRLLVSLRKAVAQNDTYNFSFTSYIPKFSMQSGIDDLIGNLEELGVTDAFDEGKANFSKMTESPFWIQNAVHKTNFDFSEEGIKAAAVTALGGFGGGGPGLIPNSSNIVISINKPFMYLVRDTKTGEIWFAGTVYEPNLWDDDKADYGR